MTEREHTSRQQHLLERKRRDAIAAQRVASILATWPPQVPELPEKWVCLGCGCTYVRGEVGSTWRFCSSCLEAAREGRPRRLTMEAEIDRLPLFGEEEGT